MVCCDAAGTILRRENPQKIETVGEMQKYCDKPLDTQRRRHI